MAIPAGNKIFLRMSSLGNKSGIPQASITGNADRGQIMIAVGHRAWSPPILNNSDNRDNCYRVPQPSDKQIRQTFHHYNDSDADNDNQQRWLPKLARGEFDLEKG